ncbi:MAG: biopolymer transporter ExbD [Bacteroidia bacterium]
MAEIDTSGGGKKGGKPKGKKMSTRVDFTPMVDLGFLLITFFMLTTTMSTPQAMELNMPVKDETIKTLIPASQTVTLLLAENDKVVYYFVDAKTKEPSTPIITNYSATGVRKMLLKESRDRNRVGIDSIPVYKKMFAEHKMTEEVLRKRISAIKSFDKGLIVVIKADDKSKYKNVVDILDEMSICNIGRYAMVDITPVEVEMIKTVKL